MFRPIIAVVIVALIAPSSFAGNISYPFYNKSKQTIVVVMDNDRERHVIQPGGGVAFREANAGDNPTFRVYEWVGGRQGKQLGADSFDSKRVGFLKVTIGGRTLYWDTRLHD